jgi:hypothetical protein
MTFLNTQKTTELLLLFQTARRVLAFVSCCAISVLSKLRWFLGHETRSDSTAPGELRRPQQLAGDELRRRWDFAALAAAAVELH